MTVLIVFKDFHITFLCNLVVTSTVRSPPSEDISQL